MKYVSGFSVLLIAVLVAPVTAQDIIQSRPLDEYIRMLRHVPTELELEVSYSLRTGYLPVGLSAPGTVHSYGTGFRAGIARRKTMLTVKGNLSRGWSIDSTIAGDCIPFGHSIRLGAVLSYNQMKRTDPVFQQDDIAIGIQRRAILGTVGLGVGIGQFNQNYIRVWMITGYYEGRHVVVTDKSGPSLESETAVLADDNPLRIVGGMLRAKKSFGQRFEIEARAQYFDAFLGTTTSLALPPQEFAGALRLSLRLIGPVWVVIYASGNTDQRFIQEDQRISIGFKYRRSK